MFASLSLCKHAESQRIKITNADYQSIFADDQFSIKSTQLNETKESYINKRQKMISKDKSMHFTVDVKSLTPQEKQLEQRIFGMRDALINVDESPLLMEVHDGIDIIKTSSLTTLLKSMPKGAHLHFHIESSLSADEFFEFTKDDSVYYSFKDDLLKTAPKGMNAPGYEK